MLAVVEIGGKQFKVEKGTIIDVDKFELNAKDQLIIDRVLLIQNKGKVTIGTPIIEGASVSFEVLEQLKDDKIIVFKFKRKTGYKVTQGHRQRLSRLKVTSIDLQSGTKTSSSKAATSTKPEKEEASKSSPKSSTRKSTKTAQTKKSTSTAKKAAEKE